MAGGNPATRSNSDPGKLKHVLVVLLGIPEADHTTKPIPVALKANGITGFEEHLLLCTVKDLEGLTYPETAGAAPADWIPLPLTHRKLLQAVIAFFHTCSRIKNGRINITDAEFDKDAFDAFRINTFRPELPIVPWHVQKETDEDALALIEWNKRVKPNKSDYKEFKDDVFWTKSKESFMDTLESQGLDHLIDETHKPTNKELDVTQMKWLYDVMSSKFLAPAAKAIVIANKKDKDTRKLWKELIEHYGASMSGMLRAQKISGYLTSTRLHEIGWRGLIQNFILHWQEQARIYNEISEEPYTDAQLIQFLNACVSGTDSLKDVLTVYKTAQSATGTSIPLQFVDYIQKLILAAQVIDAGNNRSTNP